MICLKEQFRAASSNTNSTSIKDSDLGGNVDKSLIYEEAHIPVQQLCHILKNLPEDDNISKEVLCVSQVGN